MKICLLIAMLFTMPMISANAQGPRCASVLLAYSPQKVDVTLEDLAKLTLEVELAKARGTESILNLDLRGKTQEVMKGLSLSREELRLELAPRIARLQKRRMNENATTERHKQTEREAIGKIPQYVHVETRQAVDMGEGLIGVTDVINGSRKVLYRVASEDLNFWNVMSYDLKSGQTELVAANISAVTIHSESNRLITFTSEGEADGSIVSTLHFYSLSNLKSDSAPLELKWPEDVQKMANNVPRQLVFSDDGNTFAVRSNNGVAFGFTKNPAKALNVRKFNLTDVMFTNNQEFLISNEWENTVTKWDLHLILRGTSQIQSEKRVQKLLRINNNYVAAITKAGFNTIEISSMSDDGFTTHPMQPRIAPIPLSPFYVGIENGGLVLKQLEFFSVDTLAPITMENKDLTTKDLVLSRDGKTLIVYSTSSNNSFISVFE